jgi:hypothetical protein
LERPPPPDSGRVYINHLNGVYIIVMLETSIIAALGVQFIWACFQPGMIFSGIRDKIVLLPEYIKKPFSDCPICMTPYYGTLIFLLIGNRSFEEWIVVVFCAGGINTLIAKLTD